MQVASPTRTAYGAASCEFPECTMSTFADLPQEYQTFAAKHELTFRDVLGLLNAPSLNEHMNEQRLMVLVIQLEKALQEHDFAVSEVVLCLLLRSDLQRVYSAACECGLGWVARQAGRQTGASAGSTSRLGRVLFHKLNNLAAAKLHSVRASESFATCV